MDRPSRMDALEPILELAPAKINLFLEVVGRRADGYHDVDTLTLAVSLFDEILVCPAPDGVLHLSCDDPSLSTGPDNLVVKAAHALRAATHTNLGAEIRLRKRIPIEAGLGGGSSDAAATLKALNRFWALDLTPSELHGIAASLGSDLNLFLELPAARGSGRGETVRRIVAGFAPWVVIAKPAVGCPTGEVFRRLVLDGQRRSGDAAEAALVAGDFDGLTASLFNRLERPRRRTAARDRRLVRSDEIRVDDGQRVGLLRAPPRSGRGRGVAGRPDGGSRAGRTGLGRARINGRHNVDVTYRDKGVVLWSSPRFA